MISEWTIVAQLLHYLDTHHRLLIHVWDGTAYQPLGSFRNTDCLYNNGGQLHVQLTIPGRMRYELLQQQRTWEATQPG